MHDKYNEIIGRESFINLIGISSEPYDLEFMCFIVITMVALSTGLGLNIMLYYW